MQMQEKTQELQIPSCLCFIDHEKSFGSIEHDAIWTALAKQGRTDGYIELLQRLLCNRLDASQWMVFTATRFLWSGGRSNVILFRLSCSMQFLEDVFRDVRPEWAKKQIVLAPRVA